MQHPIYYPAYSSQTLNDRYIIKRKLGNGAHSSAFLVSDSLYRSKDGNGCIKQCFGREYLAVKILTAEVTRYHYEGYTREAHFLDLIKRAQECQGTHGLPVYCEQFEISGPDGPHICLVMHIIGNSLSALRKQAPYKALPVHLVRSIVSQLVNSVAKLHNIGIMHTDIKPDNLLINSVESDEEVTRYLDENPLSSEEKNRDSPPSSSQEDGANNNETPQSKRLNVLHTQPLPLPIAWDCSPEEAQRIKVTLIDFDKAQLIGQQPTISAFAPVALRSPEEILRGNIGPKMDVWAIGCITFELLTGRWLFNPEEGETWTQDDDHLAKMMELTGDQFSPEVLQQCKYAADFFDEHGQLERIPDLLPVQIEDAIRNYKLVPEADIGPAADFIRACLKLDPEERLSAEKLREHPWLEKVVLYN